jgi:hypothetical protein
MKNISIKYWILLTALMMNSVIGYSQITIEQKLSIFSNSHINGGEFVIEYKIKGSNLNTSNTLGSLNADIIYDSSAIKFVSESNWNSQISPKTGYERYVGSNDEAGANRSVRIMIDGLNVNNDSTSSLHGYNIENVYSTIVKLNFIIVDNTKSLSITFKSATNQIGLFTYPGNNPNTFEINDQVLSAPTTIDNEPLPVTLASFNSAVKINSVTLNWVTVNEQNNAGFNIERKSATDNNWASVGYVKGQGNSNTQSSYSFEDNKLATGKYNYRLKQTDINGNFKYYSLSNIIEVGVPSKYNLSQNYPNPFNPTTKINYELPKDSKVNITVFDVLGREVISLVNQVQKAGYYTVTADGKNLASGTYFYRLVAKSDNNDYVISKKMSIIK